MAIHGRRAVGMLIRLHVEEREAIRSGAAAVGLPAASWVRSLALTAAPPAAAGEGAADPALAEGEVITPQAPAGEPITYRLIEAGQLRPSHDPWSFTPGAGYPRGLNEREYHRQREEQEKVIMGAQKLNPRLLLTDTPSATDGPPIVAGWGHDGTPLVTDDALVLGGNGRSMMMLRAFRDDPEKLDAYRRALTRRAPAFGIARAEVRRLKAPVLVRVAHGLTSKSPRADLVKAIRRYNEGMTQALSGRARAMAEAAVLSDGAMLSVAELLEAAGADATLRSVMDAEPRRLSGILRTDGMITARNSSELLASDGTFTAAAKDRIEAAFLARVVGTGDRFAATPAAVLAKLERITPPLLRVAAVNPAADAIPLVQGAVDLINDAGRRGVTLRDLSRQVDAFGEGAPPADRVALAGLIQKEGPIKLAQRFRAWAGEAAADPKQAGLFGAPPSPAELTARLLG